MKTFRILGKRGRITVPYEIRCKVGFKQNDVLSFEESKDGRSVIVRREIICDCNGEKSKERKDRGDEITLYDFLERIISRTAARRTYSFISKVGAESGWG